jgi:2-polyprenyl-3-methyl-5-hydroxy-6-metoxy-1,4-benzoquinol methylase
MSEFWEDAFVSKQLMWGLGPTQSARLATDYFVRMGTKEVLLPGIGYGRNAKPMIDAGMSVTGIEISETAIALARSQLGLDIPIHHGSVTDMPFDDKQYDAVFCYGLIYLLDAPARSKLIADCYRQLRPGGHMIFSMISKRSATYGQGVKLGEDWYRTAHGVDLFFYDEASAQREFGPYGLSELSELEEPTGGNHVFIYALCTRS